MGRKQLWLPVAQRCSYSPGNVRGVWDDTADLMAALKVSSCEIGN